MGDVHAVLLDRVPASIPGLVRDKSGVLVEREYGNDWEKGTVLDVDVGLVGVATEYDLDLDWYSDDDMQMDLTDETSRAHAAWWACANGWDGTVALNVVVESRVLDLALRGCPMTPEQIDTLARLVLRLAEGGDDAK